MEVSIGNRQPSIGCADPGSHFSCDLCPTIGALCAGPWFCQQPHAGSPDGQFAPHHAALGGYLWAERTCDGHSQLASGVFHSRANPSHVPIGDDLWGARPFAKDGYLWIGLGCGDWGLPSFVFGTPQALSAEWNLIPTPGVEAGS